MELPHLKKFAEVKDKVFEAAETAADDDDLRPGSKR